MLVHAYYPKDFRVRREAEALVRRGHIVDVVSLRQEGEPRREQVGGVNVVRLPVRRHHGHSFLVYLFEYLSFFLLVQGSLVKRLLRRRYDIVHVHTPPDFLVYAAAIPRLLGTKIVLDVHDRAPELYSERFEGGAAIIRLLALVERRCLRFANRVVTVHEPYGDRLAAAAGVARKHITIIHNSADERFFPRLESALRPEAGRPARLLHHGNMLHRLGPDVLVEAMSCLGLGADRVQLDIVGGGELLPFLQAQVVRLGLGDQVHLHGVKRLEELSNYIAHANLCIVPNRRSSFTDGILPTKLLEYVQMGRPVIVSRTKVVERYFRDESVYYVPPGDPVALAAAISQYLTDPSQFLQKVPEARKDYLPISWPTQEQHLLALIADLLGESLQIE